MPVILRFQRMGMKNRPVYRIIAIENKKCLLSGKFIEKLGVYDPHFKQDHVMLSRSHRNVPIYEPREPLRDILPFKELFIDTERCKYWLAQGAKPTPAVQRVLCYAGILPPLPNRIPQGWDHYKWMDTFRAVHRFVKAKTKIEES
jgi:ribosomal protein S16